MRKTISAVLTVILVLALVTPVSAAEVAWPDGRVTKGELRTMTVEGQLYVYLDDFNNIAGVVALNDFGDGTSRTDVAVVTAAGVTIVVDKRSQTASALLLNDEIDVTPIPCRVTDDGLAYLPLRLVAGLLGATVDYDPATGAVKVSCNSQPTM